MIYIANRLEYLKEMKLNYEKDNLMNTFSYFYIIDEMNRITSRSNKNIKIVS